MATQYTCPKHDHGGEKVDMELVPGIPPMCICPEDGYKAKAIKVGMEYDKSPEPGDTENA